MNLTEYNDIVSAYRLKFPAGYPYPRALGATAPAPSPMPTPYATQPPQLHHGDNPIQSRLVSEVLGGGSIGSITILLVLMLIKKWWEVRLRRREQAMENPQTPASTRSASGTPRTPTRGGFECKSSCCMPKLDLADDSEYKEREEKFLKHRFMSWVRSMKKKVPEGVEEKEVGVEVKEPKQ